MVRFVSLDGLNTFLVKCKEVFALKTEIPTSLPASDTTDEYDGDGDAPVNGKAVRSALRGMTADVQNGKDYDDDEIQSIIENDSIKEG